MKTQPYICRIHIENFRNFRSVDFYLSEKQVLIGENSVGKSNLLAALQLILDPTLSERDRMLDESDFWDGLQNPMENGEQILIEIYFTNFEDNQNVLAQLSDATVMMDGKETLKLTYKFFKKDGGKADYRYIIYKGDDETRAFTYEDRKILNIRVIKAIRDVEAEMRNSKTSPVTQIIKQKYSISKEVLSEISRALTEAGADTLRIGQIDDLENKIRTLINAIISFDEDEFNISLKTMNIDATKLIYALRPLINNRETGNTSLGINNILYISLILLLIEDDTIKSFLPGEFYRELKEKDGGSLIEHCYTKAELSDDYIINSSALNDPTVYNALYSFLSGVIPCPYGTTILAVEEPESHLHPIYQRLLYKHVMNRTKSSVIITTHSTHISSVAPITSLVHLIGRSDGTHVKTTAGLNFSPEDYADLTRYIDVKRGELYTAKGILFVEGIAEEYLITSFAEIMGYELDRYGVIVCNINSVDFKPYCQFAAALGIPCAVITDGDPYHIVDGEKKFGVMFGEDSTTGGFDGITRAVKIYEEKINSAFGEEFSRFDFDRQCDELSKLGVFIGQHTLEVDIFNTASNTDKKIICSIFNQLTNGGDRQKKNFLENMMAGNFYKCLSQIESSYSGIGKGRFAQRLAQKATLTMVPEYIFKAVNMIVATVRGNSD